MSTLIEAIAALSDNDHGYRYAFHLPWVLGGYRYATDARICARCPTNEPDSEVPDGYKPYPDAGNVILHPDQCHEEGIFIPELPALIDPVVCQSCSGMGGHDCPTCNQNVCCHECKSEGYESYGNFRNPFKLFEPDGYFGLRYLHILKSFGAICFLKKVEANGFKSRTIRFVAGDCEGTLMGMEKKFSEKKLSELALQGDGG